MVLRQLTRSYFLLLLPGRFFFLALPFLLGNCLLSLWNTPHFPHALILIPLTRHDAALAHLDSIPFHDLVIWTEGSVLFLLKKAAMASLPPVYFVAIRPLFSFLQAQFVQVFFFSTEACAFLQAFRWSRQHREV